jgi:hypothetical protein
MRQTAAFFHTPSESCAALSVAMAAVAAWRAWAVRRPHRPHEKRLPVTTQRALAR